MTAGKGTWLPEMGISLKFNRVFKLFGRVR